MPVQQIYQGNCFEKDANPAAADFDPLREVLRYYHINAGEDGHEFEDSPDRRNWLRWTGKPSHGGEEAPEAGAAQKAA
jgi:phenol hydroxylase P3 protein